MPTVELPIATVHNLMSRRKRDNLYTYYTERGDKNSIFVEAQDMKGSQFYTVLIFHARDI